MGDRSTAEQPHSGAGRLLQMPLHLRQTPPPLWGRHRRPAAAVLERTRCVASLYRALCARAGRGVSVFPQRTPPPPPPPPPPGAGRGRGAPARLSPPSPPSPPTPPPSPPAALR